ncbi:MAG: transcription-repair coupling factor [Elusimicrobiota bacterium]|jgi:transcription-repair coupling factor (superfamily II helicase)|nr:transcription-repair coupling factor [Elusimicrobiota bacterium]
MSKTYLSQASASAKAHYLFKLINKRGGEKNSNLRVFAFVKDDDLQNFYDDIKAFFQSETQSVLNKDNILLFPHDLANTRAFSIDKIKTTDNFILCCSESSINSLIAKPDSNNSLTIKVNQDYRFEDLIVSLSKFGYERVDFVEDILQFAVRGDIIDIWTGLNEEPVRILFEYDKIETIKSFEPISQISNTHLNEIKILSVNNEQNTATIKDYFSAQNQQNAILFFDYKISKENETAFEKYELIINDPLNSKSQNQNYKSFTGFQGNTQYFIDTLKTFAQNKIDIKIYCANNGEKERIADIFHDNKWSFAAPQFLFGNLSSGFYLESENAAYISSREMLYKRKPVSFPKVKGAKRLEGIWEMAAGDYVVHERYGIGKYLGLKTIKSGGKISDFLCIEYSKGDKLYVPPDNIKALKKYIGVEGARPKLYSMDTGAWDKIKSRARQAAKEFAKELLALYAQRSLVVRPPLKGETPWEKELADSFPYQETPDQLKAIDDVKADFLRAFPMERLICGDVGYGKTEIAVRAAFKAVQNGKQAALLAPTTILAGQHFDTFSERLSIFPVKLAVLSRFQSKSEQQKIVEQLKEGKIDIVIGTHRLLQKDIVFKDLGLLIIDEEHRFGVKQKEKIKNIKKAIDVLLLSATPIPRTLSSALSGFRDLSVIETPPLGRLPIETFLSAYDEKLLKNIISAELSRGGQVFYVYNRIDTMFSKAENLKKLIPDMRLGIIHGQMQAKDIESIMWKFINREYDILLATTIIESGLDIASVNTMIIEDAQNFGLSQLYQLRGRIGRAVQKAYCYMFYDDKDLTEEAIKRLEAMKEFNQLGSGFRLALKDLQIRGAGGILSANQHGFIRDIGYDMFVRLLEEEGGRLKEQGLAQEPQYENNIEISLSISALFPETYMKSEEIRVLFYRKLADAKDIEAINSIKSEIIDRFGKLPQESELLFEIATLKLAARALDIESIFENNDIVSIYFSQKVDFSNADFGKLSKDYADTIEFIAGKQNGFRLKKPNNSNTMEYIKKALKDLKFYLRR